MQHLQPNSTLQGGKYRIEKVLGQGGFGITYLAEQVMLGRKVAVKEFFFREYCDRDEATSHVTFGTQSNAETVQRFLQKFLKEARTISQLDHPHIVKIHDIFEENNTAYYVMDYIEGESLSDIVKKQGALSEVTAVEYIKQVASAIGYIHSKSINHLDVKPANIMIRKSDNQAVLIDFGLSKQYDEIGSQTSSTPVGISQGYAPIEQYRVGGVSTFSPQTDIYSLGATLYWLIIGKTPPAADEILDEGLPSLPSYITSEVKNAITSAMQARKKDRPENIGKWIAILDENESSSEMAAHESEEEQIAEVDESTMLIEQDNKEIVEEEEIDFDVEQYIIPFSFKNDLNNTSKLAKDGETEAMFALAIMYLRGDEKFQNFEYANMWLSKCKEKGDSRAKAILNNWGKIINNQVLIKVKKESERFVKEETERKSREISRSKTSEKDSFKVGVWVIVVGIIIVVLCVKLCGNSSEDGTVATNNSIDNVSNGIEQEPILTISEYEWIENTSNVMERDRLDIIITSDQKIRLGNDYDFPCSMEDLKFRVKEFISNPDNRANLPELIPAKIVEFGGQTVMVTTNHVIYVKPEQGSNHDVFLSVVDALSTTYYELRNELSIEEFGYKYEYLTEEQKKGCRRVYPQHIYKVDVEKTEPSPSDTYVNDEIFEVVEQYPEYPGGNEALIQYLTTNLSYPESARKNGIQGRVLVQFVVNKDGTITDIHVLRSINPALDKEAVRVVSQMSKWKPGKQKGKNVRVRFTLPITFRLQ